MRYQKAMSLRVPLKRLRTRNVSPIPSGLEHGQAAPQEVKKGCKSAHTQSSKPVYTASLPYNRSLGGVIQLV